MTRLNSLKINPKFKLHTMATTYKKARNKEDKILTLMSEYPEGISPSALSNSCIYISPLNYKV